MAAELIPTDVLRQILRHFAAGVTVITSIDGSGEPAGMTATAFSSVSLHPPMVLVCVDATAQTRQAIEGRGGFAVNLLAADQEAVARRFAAKGSDKFEGVAWRANSSGAPLIEGALAHVECRVVQAVPAGTHVIYIGEVLAGSSSAGEPLLYYEGAYRRLE